MRIHRSMVWAAAGGLMLALGSAGWSQQGNGQGGRNGSASQGVPQNGPNVPSIAPIVQPPDDRMIRAEEDQAKMRNVDRQKQLVEETQKLVALANELKLEVDKSSKDTLSLDVIRKADEIEKLAHSVKEKMKGP